MSARAQKELRQHFPKDGLGGGMIRRISGRDTLAVCPSGHRGPRGIRAEEVACDSASTKPARETTVLWGARHRQRPCIMPIVWQDRRTRRHLPAGWWPTAFGEHVPGRAHRAGRRRLLLRQPKTRLAARQTCRGARHAAENGALGLRHRGQLPCCGASHPAARSMRPMPLNASRHHAVRHRRPMLGPDPAGRPAHFPIPCCRACSTAPVSFGVTDPELLDAPIPILGIAGRPAGGNRGPGLLRAGHEQEHLWHRLLHAGQYRPTVSSPRTTACLTTVAYRLGRPHDPTRWEGSIFVAGGGRAVAAATGWA